MTSLSMFSRVLRARGVPIDGALQRAGLPALFDERPGGFVPYLRFRRFIAERSRREGLADLGSESALFGGEEGIASGIRSAIIGAPTLMSAFQMVTQLAVRQSTHLRFWLEPHGATVRVCHVNAVGPGAAPGYDIVDANATMLMMVVARQFLGPRWLPSRLLQRRVAGRRGDMQRSGPLADRGVPVLEHHDHSGIDIPTDKIWAANRGTPTSTPAASGQHLELESVAAALRVLARAYVPDGRLRIETAADLMGMSVRSLQRALAHEHTSYRHVLGLASLDVACAVLADEHVSLAEVALLIGYSEQSSFSRAFRSWTGIAPRAYRERCLAAVGPQDASARH